MPITNEMLTDADRAWLTADERLQHGDLRMPEVVWREEYAKLRRPISTARRLSEDIGGIVPPFLLAAGLGAVGAGIGAGLTSSSEGGAMGAAIGGGAGLLGGLI